MGGMIMLTARPWGPYATAAPSGGVRRGGADLSQPGLVEVFGGPSGIFFLPGRRCGAVGCGREEGL